MPQPATSDVADPGLAEAGRARIAWADRSMPVLAQVRKRFTADQPFAGLRLAACLHVTAETACFVRTLAAGGAQVALCASNPLSTQDDVAAALAREDSVTVYARAGLDRPGYYRHIDQALDLRPHLVFDDGCDLVNTVHTARRELLQADLRLTVEYPGPADPVAPCPVAALCGVDDPRRAGGDATQAWSRWSSGPFAVHLVPGGHLDLLAPGRAEEFWVWLARAAAAGVGPAQGLGGSPLDLR